MTLANIGMPMVCVTVPTMLLALPLIAVAEAFVLSRVCRLPFKEAWHGALRANLWSTLLGIPVAWFALVAAQIAGGAGRAWGLDTPMDRLAAVTLQAPWLIPYEREMYWMLPAASLVLLAPFFLASVLAEYLVLCRRWGAAQTQLWSGVALANALSYSLLAGYYAVQLWIGWDRGY